MKKIAIIAFVLLIGITVVVPAQTYGVGGAFSIDALGGLPSSALLSFKVPQTPLLWGLGLQVSEETFNMAFTADWWLYHEPLVGFLSLYVGPGFYASFPDRLDIGGRVPVGLNAYPIEVLELFVELAPTLLVLSDGGINFPDFGLQGAFGLRFWFNT